MNQPPPNIWGVLPAAGIGRRMGSERPKQYLTVQGKSILEHSLHCLLSHSRIHKVVVVIAAQDSYWPSIHSKMAEDRVLTALGGAERSHSVYAGLLALADIAQPHDWVLVHDAVRPCVKHQDIDRLILGVENHQRFPLNSRDGGLSGGRIAILPPDSKQKLVFCAAFKQGSHSRSFQREWLDHASGGLLALPVRDTLKMTDGKGIVTGTLDRTSIWQAQTPQMFRLAELTAALAQAINLKHPVTDEASAIEFAGGQSLVIPGHIDNIKVTHPDDLFWLEHYLGTKTCV